MNERMNRFLKLVVCFSGSICFILLFGFKKEISPNEKSIATENATVNPTLYLATLTFDGNSFFDGGETNFPLSFSFNVSQDGNGDGKVDVEDNLENVVLYSIGNKITGEGRTGISSRGPNDQRPAIYFHCDTVGTYQVYEYWLYYAD